jgi:hypothetical protein
MTESLYYINLNSKLKTFNSKLQKKVVLLKTNLLKKLYLIQPF